MHFLLLHCSNTVSPVAILLVCPANEADTAFLEECLASCSLHGRLASLLQRMGRFEDKSLHPFRSGLATQMAAAGCSSQQIAHPAAHVHPSHLAAVLCCLWAPCQQGQALAPRQHGVTASGPASQGLALLRSAAAWRRSSHDVQPVIVANLVPRCHWLDVDQRVPGVLSCWPA